MENIDLVHFCLLSLAATLAIHMNNDTIKAMCLGWLSFRNDGYPQDRKIWMITSLVLGVVTILFCTGGMAFVTASTAFFTGVMPLLVLTLFCQLVYNGKNCLQN